MNRSLDSLLHPQSPQGVSIFSSNLSCSVYHHTYHINTSLSHCRLPFHQHRALIPRMATSYDGQVLNKKSNMSAFSDLSCCIARSESRYSMGATKTRISDRWRDAERHPLGSKALWTVGAVDAVWWRNAPIGRSTIDFKKYLQSPDGNHSQTLVQLLTNIKIIVIP